jgi:small subunit ribosomal protein S9
MTIKKEKTKEEKPKVKKVVKKTTSVKSVADKEIKVNYIRTVGRRKSAVARVRLFKDGTGKITVNGKDWKAYFPTMPQRFAVFAPLKLTGQGDKLDFTVKVAGGGPSSQADAVRHGISRGLLKFNEEFRASLKKAGFLTRDPRKKERKKPGLKRARRAPQWKKR